MDTPTGSPDGLKVPSTGRSLSSTVADAFLDINFEVTRQRTSEEVGMKQDTVSTNVVNMLRQKVPEGAKSRKALSSSRIGALLTLESMRTLYDEFLQHGGPAMTLPLNHFADLISTLLRRTSRTGELSDEDKIEIKRWAMSFAASEGGKVGSTAVSMSFKYLNEHKEAASNMSVSWSDVTSNLIYDGTQRDLIEEFTSDYLPRPAVVNPHESGAPHTQYPSHALISQTTNRLITSGKDGLVKVWNASSGTFERHLYNGGFSWVTALSFFGNDETLGVVTSNGQLSILDVSSGSVIKKYAGSPTTAAAVRSVQLHSTVFTKRYGILPGECGFRQMQIPDLPNLTLDEFVARRKAFREAPQRIHVPATPIIGFSNPSAFWYLSDDKKCSYGTGNGEVGIFDISEDLRQTSTVGGSRITEIELDHKWKFHTDYVSGIRYTSRHHELISVGLDGGIMKIHTDRYDRPMRHNAHDGPHTKPIHGVDWCEQLQMMATFSSDKKLRLWSLLRPEPLHVFDPMATDILSMTVIPERDQIAVITADQTITWYDLRTFRVLQSMEQREGGRPVRSNTGIVMYNPEAKNVVSVMKRPMFYDPIAKEKSPEPNRATNKSPEHQVKNTHPIISINSSRKSRMLYTFDAHTMHVWDIITGENIYSVGVVKQMARLGVFAASTNVSCSSWTDFSQSCLLSGCQGGGLLKWNPLNGQITNSESSLASTKQGPTGSDVSCMDQSRGVVAVCSGFRVQLIVDKDKRSDIVSSVRQIEAPDMSTITTCRFLHNTNLAIGTLNGVVHIVGYENNRDWSVNVLPDSNTAGIESIEWVNSEQRGLIIALLDSGVAAIVSFRERRVLYHLTILDSLTKDVTLFSSCLTPSDDLLFVGDSLGRVFVLDIMSLKKDLTGPDLEEKLSMVHVFQASTDAVTSIEYLGDELAAFAVGSLDGSVRLFKLDGRSVTHIGTFGSWRWDLNEPGTFERSHHQRRYVRDDSIKVKRRDADNFLRAVVAESFRFNSPRRDADTGTSISASVRIKQGRAKSWAFLTNTANEDEDDDDEVNSVVEESDDVSPAAAASPAEPQTALPVPPIVLGDHFVVAPEAGPKTARPAPPARELRFKSLSDAGSTAQFDDTVGTNMLKNMASRLDRIKKPKGRKSQTFEARLITESVGSPLRSHPDQPGERLLADIVEDTIRTHRANRENALHGNDERSWVNRVSSRLTISQVKAPQPPMSKPKPKFTIRRAQFGSRQ